MKTTKLMMLIVKLFGKKIITKEGEYKTTAYHFRNMIYISEHITMTAEEHKAYLIDPESFQPLKIYGVTLNKSQIRWYKLMKERLDGRTIFYDHTVDPDRLDYQIKPLNFPIDKHNAGDMIKTLRDQVESYFHPRTPTPKKIGFKCTKIG